MRSKMLQDRFLVLASLHNELDLAREIDIKQFIDEFARSSVRRIQHDAPRLNKFLLCCSEHDLPASDKIQTLHTALKSSSTLSSPLTPPRHTSTNLSVFSHVTEEVSKCQSSNAFRDLYPTSLIKQCLSVLLPTLTTMINMSFGTCVFPDQFKAYSVIPLSPQNTILIKKICPTMLISHLSFLSRITERVVKNRLTQHLSSNKLLNKLQSAYTKYHSTESIHSLSPCCL